jgi:hypothetical protein
MRLRVIAEAPMDEGAVAVVDVGIGTSTVGEALPVSFPGEEDSAPVSCEVCDFEPSVRSRRALPFFG